jgi:hypothetical protein
MSKHTEYDGDVVHVVVEKGDETRITSYEARGTLTGGIACGSKLDDITVKSDGSVYRHSGTWPHNSTTLIRSADE